MLILRDEQVEYCRVRNLQTGEILVGIAYRNRLFIAGKSYPLSQKQEAIDYLRQQFAANNGLVYLLLVQDEDKFTLWYENGELEQIEADPVSLFDLQQVAKEMRSPEGGIEIQDRRYRLRVYRLCFTGQSATDWLEQRYQLSRSDAVRLGQRLVSQKWIHHVVDDHDFKDEYLFYRFYADENE